jgi:hypothetical protein
MKTFPITQVVPEATAGIVSAPIAVPIMGTPFVTLAAAVAVVAGITAPARLVRIDLTRFSENGTPLDSSLKDV